MTALIELEEATRPVVARALADLRRRRARTAIVLLVAFLASGAATQGLALLARNARPYDRAFGILALGTGAAIVVNLVTGIVTASFRDVGVMKALGFTPGQVVATITVAMLVPATAGGVPGVIGGALLGLPESVPFSPALGLAALAATLAAVALAAGLPALRAGRLSPVRAIAAGASAATGGLRLRRALGRRMPRPVAFGVAEAFARPLRDLLTTLTVLAGVATVTFAVGSHAVQGRGTGAVSAVLSLIAAAGVLSTVLLTARERARDTAVLRALGMTPAEALVMALSSAGALAVVGAVLGAALCVALI